MKAKPIQIEKYGSLVWANQETDELRRTECLCFNCEMAGNCSIAAEGLELCRKHNTAFMVTRCPNWVSNGR